MPFPLIGATKVHDPVLLEVPVIDRDARYIAPMMEKMLVTVNPSGPLDFFIAAWLDHDAGLQGPQVILIIKAQSSPFRRKLRRFDEVQQILGLKTVPRIGQRHLPVATLTIHHLRSSHGT
jgi:hypothetical protein